MTRREASAMERKTARGCGPVGEPARGPFALVLVPLSSGSPLVHRRGIGSEGIARQRVGRARQSWGDKAPQHILLDGQKISALPSRACWLNSLGEVPAPTPLFGALSLNRHPVSVLDLCFTSDRFFGSLTKKRDAGCKLPSSPKEYLPISPSFRQTYQYTSHALTIW